MNIQVLSIAMYLGFGGRVQLRRSCREGVGFLVSLFLIQRNGDVGYDRGGGHIQDQVEYMVTTNTQVLDQILSCQALNKNEELLVRCNRAHQVVEILYSPQSLQMSSILSRFLPRCAFWYDPQGESLESNDNKSKMPEKKQHRSSSSYLVLTTLG